ncbi:MAG: Sulfur carrier protein adenylyltransferase ThiF [Polyangiaceae bacterium]|jgi:adenylyltransferase/sulfurtransferase|nr:Sulfur carrier protein adenylyltransferase ThiF [Polyangiaceae bacterium]
MSERPKRVLIVGLGGLGCPVAAILARASSAELWLCDDDEVDLTNLHRQILYRDADVGTHKLDAARKTLILGGVDPSRLVSHRARLLPDNARQLVSEVDVVVEGADNFATKFLAADAARLVGRPIVHGAAVRFVGTAWAVAAQGAPCYRCLFEDVPPGAQQGCTEAGVMGPVVGLCGALMADLTLRVLQGDATAFGSLYTYDGQTDRLRQVPATRRSDCPLCGSAPSIRDLAESRYTNPSCAA